MTACFSLFSGQTNRTVDAGLVPRPVVSSLTQTGGVLAVEWASEPGLKLQRTLSLRPPNWTDVAGSEGQSRMELPTTNAHEYFRLVRP